MKQKQIELYKFMKKFALTHGYPPTMDDIRRKANIYKSKSSIHDAMMALADNGYITLGQRLSGRAYSIKGLKMVEDL